MLPRSWTLFAVTALSIAGVGASDLGAQTGTIEGRVTDAETGAVMAGVEVSLEGADRGVLSATDGTFSIPDVPTGTHTVVANAIGYGTVRREVSVRSGQTLRLEVEVSRQAVEVAGITVTGQREYAAEQTATVVKMDASILDIPRSVQVVTSDYLEDQQVSQLTDVFRNVSGVNTFSDYIDYTIRGFRTSEILVNGYRAESSYFFSPPRMANVERVEVLKGPSAFLYGAFEPGGIVNIVTKKPQAQTVRSAFFGFGGHGRLQGSLDFAGAFATDQDILYRLTVGYERFDGFRPHEDGRAYEIHPALTWLIDPATSIHVSAEYVDDRAGFKRGKPAPGGDLDAVATSWVAVEPDDYTENQGIGAEVALEHSFNDAWKIRAATRFGRPHASQKAHSQTGFINDASGSPVAIGRQYYDYFWNHQILTPEVRVLGDVSTGSVRHRLLFGGDVRWYSMDAMAGRASSSSGVPPLSLTNPVYTADPATYDIQYTDWTEERTTTAIYVQDLATLHPMVDLLLGARYDHYQGEFCFGCDGDPGTVDTDAVTLKGGLLVHPARNTTLYASYGEGYNTDALSFSNRPDVGGPFDPETSWQVEVGGKAALFEDRVMATAAYYLIRKQNMLSYSGDGERYFQTGEVESRGLEFDATGAILPNWSIVANYSHNTIEVTEDEDPSRIGMAFPNAPKHSAAFWTRYDIPSWRLGIGAGLSFVGERDTFAANTTIPSYTVMDGGLYYDRDWLQLAIKVNNIFDEDHFTGAYDDEVVFPGWPRTVVLTVRTRM